MTTAEVEAIIDRKRSGEGCVFPVLVIAAWVALMVYYLPQFEKGPGTLWLYNRGQVEQVRVTRVSEITMRNAIRYYTEDGEQHYFSGPYQWAPAEATYQQGTPQPLR